MRVAVSILLFAVCSAFRASDQVDPSGLSGSETAGNASKNVSFPIPKVLFKRNVPDADEPKFVEFSMKCYNEDYYKWATCIQNKCELEFNKKEGYYQVIVGDFGVAAWNSERVMLQWDHLRINVFHVTGDCR
eukprot:s961_g14.t1